MSLGIVIKAAEGLVLASESRVTYTVNNNPLTFDTVTKLFSFKAPHNFFGFVTFGNAGIGSRTVQSYVPEFESSLPVDKRLSMRDYADLLSKFFKDHFDAWRKDNPDATTSETHFVLGGFDQAQPYGTTFSFMIPGAPKPVEGFAGNQFGIRWGGQRDVVDRLLMGYDPDLPGILQRKLGYDDAQMKDLLKELAPLQKNIPFDVFGLQDAVDLATLFIRTTIESQRLTVQLRGCGGPIDLATITRTEGLSFVQRKTLHGER